MGETSNKEFPYQSLGTWLRRMRLKKQETLAEVSGAVEIDVTRLADMEKGVQRPTEDILMLLISYFSVGEDEAVKLWELAGYDAPLSEQEVDIESQPTMIQPVIVVPLDTRIVYTDMAQIDTNKYGLTMHFMQSAGTNGKSIPVSRVGMSREHAEKLLENLQHILRPQPPKLLSAPVEETPQDSSQQS